MKSISFFVSLFALVLLTSCSKDSPSQITEPEPLVDESIQFTVSIEQDPESKVSTGLDFKSVFQAGDEIGVFAVRTPNSLAASGNYIHNVKFTYNGTSWTTATPLYYPGMDQIDVYAYYPYINNGALNPTSLSFSVLTDQSAASNYSKSDLMAATRQTNLSKSTNPIALTFKHLLALVQVEIDPTYINPNILTASLRGCTVGATLNLSTNTLTPAGGASQAIGMFRIETSSSRTYTFRALVPAQTVGSGTRLCVLQQNGRTQQSPALTAPLSLQAGAGKRYITNFSLPTISPPLGIEVVPIPGTNFYMGKYEVTFNQYHAYCNATGVAKPPSSSSGNWPVMRIDWNEANVPQ